MVKLDELYEPKGNEDKSGPQDYKVFVDMDGVVADFVEGVKKIMPGYDDSKYDKDKEYSSMMWKAVNKYHKEGGRLWAELPMMPDGQKLWDFLEAHDPEILTATGGHNLGAGEQKKEWVIEKFGGDVVVNLVDKSEQKAKFADDNYILIDDRLEKSIKPWVAAGGIGIHHTSAAKTIAELKELGF